MIYSLAVAPDIRILYALFFYFIVWLYHSVYELINLIKVFFLNFILSICLYKPSIVFLYHFNFSQFFLEIWYKVYEVERSQLINYISFARRWRRKSKQKKNRRRIARELNVCLIAILLMINPCIFFIHSFNIKSKWIIL